MTEDSLTVPSHFLTVVNAEHIRLTEAGRDAYRARFARVGIAVDDITTREQLLAALEASHDVFLELLTERVRQSGGTAGGKALLTAILQGKAFRDDPEPRT
jgi:hypothetical protein